MRPRKSVRAMRPRNAPPTNGLCGWRYSSSPAVSTAVGAGSSTSPPPNTSALPGISNNDHGGPPLSVVTTFVKVTGG